MKNVLELTPESKASELLWAAHRLVPNSVFDNSNLSREEDRLIDIRTARYSSCWSLAIACCVGVGKHAFNLPLHHALAVHPQGKLAKSYLDLFAPPVELWEEFGCKPGSGGPAWWWSTITEEGNLHRMMALQVAAEIAESEGN